MWETIFNVGMVVVGMGFLMLVSWAVDKHDKTYDGLDYNDED